MNSPTYDPKRGRWIPWVFAGGLLLVVVVNMVLVYFATSTFSGVTVPRSYERGRGYEQVIAEAARQDALGWSAEVSLSGGALRVAATDREGRPIYGRVEGVLLRPLDGTEIPLAFNATGSGRWAAEVVPPRPGLWEARLTLFGPNETPFDIRQRVMAQ
ncbi:FixH family protein [Neoroseomonas soli]|uniref:Nitrogen fixation protein fixH n=1 Tax=Neoroseomonas soli TaxID=1081025 RepID=A0A9X9X243_9PROT|nr:FixH family protein [Neoroseomonas soli]MBR0673472.1 nitrogen fixation protein fixH [Neoroseomonas soli]